MAFILIGEQGRGKWLFDRAYDMEILFQSFLIEGLILTLAEIMVQN